MIVMAEMKTSGEALVMRNFAPKASDNTKLCSIERATLCDTAKDKVRPAAEGSHMTWCWQFDHCSVLWRMRLAGEL